MADSPADNKARTCGKIYIPSLGKKINVHAKAGESCADARKRVAAKWKSDPNVPSGQPGDQQPGYDPEITPGGGGFGGGGASGSY